MSDLLEKARFVTDPVNQEVVKEIVANANAWCRAHMNQRSLTEDMLDIWEDYVKHLDISQDHWRLQRWKLDRMDIFAPRSGFQMRHLIPMKVKMKR